MDTGPRKYGQGFRIFLRWSNQAVWLLATVGVALMCIAGIAMPLARWGALIVFAVGLWVLAGAL